MVKSNRKNHRGRYAQRKTVPTPPKRKGSLASQHMHDRHPGMPRQPTDEAGIKVSADLDLELPNHANLKLLLKVVGAILTALGAGYVYVV